MAKTFASDPLLALRLICGFVQDYHRPPGQRFADRTLSILGDAGFKIQFSSDDTVGLCREALAAFAAGNRGFVPSFGNDALIRAVCDTLRPLIGHDPLAQTVRHAGTPHLVGRCVGKDMPD